MRVLVLNTGSSSVKFSLVEAGSERVLFSGMADWSAHPAGIQFHRGSECWSSPLSVSGPRDAVQQTLHQFVAGDRPLLRQRTEVAAIGHRVVHGGMLYQAGVRITDAVKKGLQQLCELAPLHNPISLEAIEATQHACPDIPQVAVFDTAFHRTLPAAAWTYAVPHQWTEEWGLRRYGFHGLSHAYCTDRAAQLLGRQDLRLVRYLGQGCSVAAVRNGTCVDTSMGFTPLDGLVMGTRSGSVDPGLLIHVLRHHGLSADDLDRVLNRESGLLGISCLSNDMRQLQEAADAGQQCAGLAIDVFVHRLRKTIGAMAAVLGGIDCLVFTAGIGENSAPIRQRTCAGLEFLGLHLDLEANQHLRPDSDIATRESPGRILVLQTREDLSIVRETVRVLGAEGK